MNQPEAQKISLVNRTDLPLTFKVSRDREETTVEAIMGGDPMACFNYIQPPPAPFIKWREYAKEKPSPGQYCIVWFCSKATAATYGRAGASIQDKFYSYQTCVLLPDIAYWIEYTDIPGPS